MAKRKNSRAASGAGTIRQRSNGGWEGRYTVGHDEKTGKQIQRSVYGKTQKEVREKLSKITAELDAGTYIPPQKLTVSDWLTIWTSDFLGDIRPKTIESYKCQIENHIRPELGAIKLQALNTPTIQKFYNDLGKEKDGKKGLSPKSVKVVHGVLHRALGQAVAIGYLRSNPSDYCTLPRREKKEIRPLDEDQSRAFLKAVEGHPFEAVFRVTLFTGLREGEVLGLTWENIDFDRGTIWVNRQLQNTGGEGEKFSLVPTKSTGRVITPAPTVMKLLKAQKVKQAEAQLMAGPEWSNPWGLVFTNATGGHLNPYTVYKKFKEVVASIGAPEARFHDLRHSYAVAAIRAGDDIKTVQGNLGHATAAFTLDVYGHVTDQMKQDSAARMERYIEGL